MRPIHSGEMSFRLVRPTHQNLELTNILVRTIDFTLFFAKSERGNN